MAGNANSGNRTTSNPYMSKRADAIDPADNRIYLTFIRRLNKLPKCDLTDPDAIDERTDLFLDLCAEHDVRPLVTSYAIALGINRSTLYRLCAGYEGVVSKVTPDCIESLKNGCAIIESAYENQLVNAKSGQVGVIFALKQQGWRDSIEVETPTHKQQSPRLSGLSTDEIAKKYMEQAGADIEQYDSLPAPPPANAYEVPREIV